MGGDEKDTKKYSFVSLPRSAVEKLEKGYRWVVSVQMSASFCVFFAQALRRVGCRELQSCSRCLFF